MYEQHRFDLNYDAIIDFNDSSTRKTDIHRGHSAYQNQSQ